MRGFRILQVSPGRSIGPLHAAVDICHYIHQPVERGTRLPLTHDFERVQCDDKTKATVGGSLLMSLCFSRSEPLGRVTTLLVCCLSFSILRCCDMPRHGIECYAAPEIPFQVQFCERHRATYRSSLNAVHKTGLAPLP